MKKDDCLVQLVNDAKQFAEDYTLEELEIMREEYLETREKNERALKFILFFWDTTISLAKKKITAPSCNLEAVTDENCSR